jgi:error-prone DNA polymerase
MFIKIEDETGAANVVGCPSLFEKRRRVVLGSNMMAVNGRIRREGEVVHLVAQQLFDLSAVADMDVVFKAPSGRGDGLLTARQMAGILSDRQNHFPRRGIFSCRICT